MDGTEPGSPAQVDGVGEYDDYSTVMQEYLYPGQWFDDLGSIISNSTPGLAWDVGTSPLSRSETNRMLNAYQDMGIDPYPGE